MQKHRKTSRISGINESWTLFLDRDGVINHRLIDEYVRTPSEFRFFEGVPESISYFNTIFRKVVIVTNQQGIGKGLMDEDDLALVNKYMLEGIAAAGGHIDRIYHCAGLKQQMPLCRKPQIGMALQARKDFPEIEFGKSVMVGDSKTDLQFGKRVGMKTVFIGNAHPEILSGSILADLRLDTLSDLADYLRH
jgi:histidinol-phosphate phosphatase family protein